MQTSPSTVKDWRVSEMWVVDFSYRCGVHLVSTTLSYRLALAFPALDGNVLLESLGLPACLPLSLSWTLFPSGLDNTPVSVSLCLSVSPCVTISVHMRPYYSLSPSCPLPSSARYHFFSSLTRPLFGLILLQSS